MNTAWVLLPCVMIPNIVAIKQITTNVKTTGALNVILSFLNPSHSPNNHRPQLHFLIIQTNILICPILHTESIRYRSNLHKS